MCCEATTEVQTWNCHWYCRQEYASSNLSFAFHVQKRNCVLFTDLILSHNVAFVCGKIISMMKKERTFTMRWEAVGWMRRQTTRWCAHCCKLLRLTIDLQSMTFNVHWKVNTASTFLTSLFITYFKRKVFIRSVPIRYSGCWLLIIVNKVLWLHSHSWLIINRICLFLLVLWLATRFESATPHHE